MTSSSIACSGWVETADEWLQRCRRDAYRLSEPVDPWSAAWAFVQGKRDDRNSCRHGYGTGISFVDLALRKHGHQQQPQQATPKLPIIDLVGANQVGKTWTLLSLAARFVVSTRPSAFGSASENTSNSFCNLPQVIFCDSNYDMNASKLAYTVRATLLMQYGGTCTNSDQLKADMECCLGRIHIATASDMMGWVPILETLRYKLMTMKEFPTLILWDDFLFGSSNDVVSQTETIRQLTRLLQDCCILLVTTSSKLFTRYDWSKVVTQRIRLDRVPSASLNDEGNVFFATVNEDRVPYFLSLSGILF